MRQRVKIVIKEEIVRELYAIAGEDAVQTAEPMKNHTTFRVGGPADYFVAPHTEEEIRKIVALCEEKEIPWFVTGNGSKKALIANASPLIRSCISEVKTPLST